MEKKLLQALIVEPDRINRVKEKLTPNDFNDKFLAEVFKSLVKANDKGQFNDGMSYFSDILPEELKKDGFNDLVRLGELHPIVIKESEFDSLVEEIKRNRRARSFHFIRVSDIEVKAPDWLIEGFIENNSLIMFFGDPDSCKTFAGLDVGGCIAIGKDFHGKKVKQNGAILYIAGEGRGGFSRRMMAWEIENGVSLQDAPFYVSNGPASFSDAVAAKEVEDAVERVARDNKISLIVIDTLARNFGTGDENSTKDMNMVIATLDRIRITHNCAILLIHHSGHADKTRARGAMALRGALDCEYKFDKDVSGIIRMEATKMKDAMLPEPIAFTIKPVDLGIYDTNGNMVTSAVLKLTEYSEREKCTSAGQGKNQTKVLEVLRGLYERKRLLLEEREDNPDNARVTVDDWRKACFEAGIKRSSFYACKNSLTAHRLIRVENNYVYETKSV